MKADLGCRQCARKRQRGSAVGGWADLADSLIKGLGMVPHDAYAEEWELGEHKAVHKCSMLAERGWRVFRSKEKYM